eukprot:TRINITY_DN15372_c0_g1_i1.p1 TRINITY_DN15372_c0_g1~~TRINITY_DN15372_c0_g1_i1.p1  ORF type:complete len:1047 (+),score=257.96 TRINITY_DN15372_c0_g1_i1:95-3142(+)
MRRVGVIGSHFSAPDGACGSRTKAHPVGVHVSSSSQSARLSRIPRLHADILSCIGNTPMVYLNRMSKGLPGRVAVKLECENPGKSVKDRLAFALVRDAEAAGLISPGRTTLVEATSGNTGISLAMVGASKGYRVTLTMPETMSLERQVVLRAFGAELVLTPSAKGMSGAKARAQEIVNSINKSTQETGQAAFLTSQFETHSNARIHRETTGPEIWRDTEGKVDVVVMGVGTGGTITGVQQYIRPRKAECRYIAVEPAESPALAAHRDGVEFVPKPHRIQGIGAGFVPKVLDTSALDDIIAVGSDEAIATARRLPQEEGILAGISAGAIVLAAMRVAAREESAGKLIVAVVPSHTERYLSSPLYSALQKECLGLEPLPLSAFPLPLPPIDSSPPLPAAGNYLPDQSKAHRIRDSVTECIGDTPLVALKRVSSGLKAQVAIKLDGENPGKSVKDRLALAMIMDAERAGLAAPGVTTLVEATSGNTGIAVAMIGAARGYRVKLVMPASMSIERRVVCRCLGAELVVTPDSLGMAGARWKALEIVNGINGCGAPTAAGAPPQAFLINQFDNPSNVKVHYETTGPEIWRDTQGKVDVVVLGVGTGGTITGVAQYLKSRNPAVRIVAVEPAESPAIARHRAGQSFVPQPHGIQGIGAGFIPGVLDVSLIDEIIGVRTQTACETARSLALQEGIFSGVSTGAALYAALQVAGRAENAGKLVVTLSPSEGERYLSHPYLQPLVDECHSLPVFSAGSSSSAKPPPYTKLWEMLRAEAAAVSQRETRLQAWFNGTILDQPSFASAIAEVISPALTSTKTRGIDLVRACAAILYSNPKILQACAVDCWRYTQIDAALQDSREPHLPPFLFYKGFHAICIHRIAHHEWVAGREWMALLLQSASSAAFGVDIHPGAAIGPGVTLDHATGIVIGGTAVVGRNVQFLHDITLGATGKHGGDRHPKIGDDCVLGAHCQILGNIQVGEGSVVAAAAVVNRPVDPGCTVAGIPAKVVKHSPMKDVARFYDAGL